MITPIFIKGEHVVANHKSAKKRIRQTIRRRKVNKDTLSRLRTLEKSLRQAIDKKDKNKALEQLKIFSTEMDRSIHKGIQHKNKVSRKMSRLSLLVNNI